MAYVYNSDSVVKFNNPILLSANAPLDVRIALDSIDSMYVNATSNTEATGDLINKAYNNMLVVAGKGEQAMVYICKDYTPYTYGHYATVNASNFDNYWITHNVINTGEGNIKLPAPIISYTWNIDNSTYDGTTTSPNATYGNNIVVEKGTSVKVTGAKWKWEATSGAVTPILADGSFGTQENPVAGTLYPTTAKEFTVTTNTDTVISQSLHNDIQHAPESTSSISVKFVNPIFYGSSASDVSTASTVLNAGFTKTAVEKLPEEITLDCSVKNGKYMYLVIPQNITFDTYINGLQYNGWVTTDNITITYKGNNSAVYTIYKSEYKQTSKEIIVKLIQTK